MPTTPRKGKPDKSNEGADKSNEGATSPREEAQAATSEVPAEGAAAAPPGPGPEPAPAMPSLAEVSAGLTNARPPRAGQAMHVNTNQRAQMARAESTVRPRGLPVQAAMIDRSVPLATFNVDIKVKVADKVISVWRRPLGYPSGAMAPDPTRFPASVDPRTAVCHTLAPRAAARCAGGRGYF